MIISVTVSNLFKLTLIDAGLYCLGPKLLKSVTVPEYDGSSAKTIVLTSFSLEITTSLEDGQTNVGPAVSVR